MMNGQRAISQGAQHLWINEFVNHLADLPADKNAPIVVYCQSGYRGGIAAVMLNLLGYTNVRNLSGGLNSWVSAELPLAGVPLDINTVMANYVARCPKISTESLLLTSPPN